MLKLQRADYDGARLFLLRAVRIREQANEQPAQLARALRLLGAAHHGMGSFNAAQGHYERARPMLATSMGPGSEQYAIFLRDLAQVYTAQSDFDAAAATYGESLEIMEHTHASNDPVRLQVADAFKKLTDGRSVPPPASIPPVDPKNIGPEI